MNKKNFNKGVLLTSLGSFWWGFFGVIYFKYISFAGHIEVLIHRSVWTTFVLIVTTFLFSKWSIFIKIVSDKKKLFIEPPKSYTKTTGPHKTILKSKGWEITSDLIFENSLLVLSVLLCQMRHYKK